MMMQFVSLVTLTLFGKGNWCELIQSQSETSSSINSATTTTTSNSGSTFVPGFSSISKQCIAQQKLQSVLTGTNQQYHHDRKGYCQADIWSSNKSFSKEGQQKKVAKEGHHEDHYIQIIITFKNAVTNLPLQQKFKLTMESLLYHSSVPIQIYILGDADSQEIAKQIIQSSVKSRSIMTSFVVATIDADEIAFKLHSIVEPMQRHFSYKPGAYYSDTLFFLSIAIHQVMPSDLHRVIMLDADLKFRSDIVKLHSLFREFDENQVIGIARENQPVYRHAFSAYRSKHPGTRVGEPPPNGLTGFNSGVLLLDLEAMRRSKLYNSLINEDTVKSLTKEYQFKGHLGDQDFFTLLSLNYSQLFYILPCGWNRQLCTWWKHKGYENVFDQYYTCDEQIHIYHGNCNSPIPED